MYFSLRRRMRTIKYDFRAVEGPFKRRRRVVIERIRARLIRQALNPDLF